MKRKLALVLCTASLAASIAAAPASAWSGPSDSGGGSGWAHPMRVCGHDC